MKKITAFAVLGLITACGSKFDSPENIIGNSTSSGIQTSKVDLNLHPMNKTVCDPFDGGNQTQVMSQGVQGTLYYKTGAMPDLQNAADYATFAKKSDKTLFFDDINVPTRLFNEGFSTQTTGVMKDDDGNKLVEYFGIKFESNIQLTADDEEGTYEISVLSDDGARLKIKDPVDDTWKEIVNNDGAHPTRMGCATRTIQMTRRTSIPIELVYYQGPRQHIANVMMWRKVSEAGKDSSCGMTGNETFFDPNHGSAPLRAYNDLLSRSWKPLVAGNFWLNGKGNYNPCVEGTIPVISDLNVGEMSFKDVALVWKTNIASSTQVRFVNQATGVETLTSSDNMLSLDHRISITGLTPGVTYTAQAVSISQDLGKAISAVITFTMP